MIELKLLSPQLKDIDKENLILKISHTLYKASYGISLDKVPVFFSYLTTDKANNLSLPHIQNEKEIVSYISAIYKIIGHLTYNSERVYQKLAELNTLLLKKYQLESIYKDFHEPDKNLYFHKMDFMKHKDCLSKILKSDKIQGLLENNAKFFSRKNLTRTLNQYILDRNVYTHGELIYWVDEKSTIISHFSNTSKKTIFSYVDQEILRSFNEVTIKLLKIINTISESTKYF